MGDAASACFNHQCLRAFCPHIAPQKISIPLIFAPNSRMPWGQTLQMADIRVATSSIGSVGFAGEVVCKRLVENLVAAGRGIAAREVPVADGVF